MGDDEDVILGDLQRLKYRIAATLESDGPVTRFGAEASAERIVDEIILEDFRLVRRPTSPPKE